LPYSGLPLHFDDILGVGHRVRHRNFDHDVFAGAHALNRLAGMHLRGRGKDRRLDTGLCETLAKVKRPVGNLEPLGHCLRRVGAAAGERHDFNAGDVLQGLQMLDPECALPCHTDLHVVPLTVAPKS